MPEARPPADPATPDTVVRTWQEPPRVLSGILRQLGPGLIIAGSIVGSGELIGTTRTGAQAGFFLLWLIVIGCVIKVFVQVEFGRYALNTGKATMAGLNEVPGPRLARANWILWYWLVMFLISLGQLGGIVGSVGEALAITWPVTDQGRIYHHARALDIERHTLDARLENAGRAAAGSSTLARDARDEISRRIAAIDAELAPLGTPERGQDAKIWATLVTVFTSVLLVVGRYGLIQSVATFLVAAFTLATVANVLALQTIDEWAVHWSDFALGFSFQLPESGKAIGTALATFGIIGVGANELIAYPYWCVEKGYARYTGAAAADAAWAERAQGWMRVMRWDAWCSMVVYTFATVAFYLLGAAVLSRIGLIPSDDDLILTLCVMYQPVFGAWAMWLFLFGALAVLYSTFFIANAGHARVAADAGQVLGAIGNTAAAKSRATKLLCGAFPLICLAVYVVFPKPTTLVLLSGAMQAIMLPMLAVAALYFRYRRCDRRVMPGKLWDALLWVSVAGLFVAGGWTTSDAGGKLVEQISRWFETGT
ncbi:MAG: transmembrane Mn(2+) transporter [Planctomycetota bacterium]|nr:MAG: transmembrane Mn(2+) transporter [Planctomycetota bacterium]